jgi:hypothetical protein
MEAATMVRRAIGITRAQLWCACLVSSAFAQQYTTIPPNGSVSFWACVSPPPDFPQWISFSSSVQPNSGYHDHHGSNRPAGNLGSTGGWTDSNGCVSTSFNVPEQIAGVYEVQASGFGFTDTLVVYVVLQPYLQNLPPHYSYQLVGETGAHTFNHFGTFNAVYRLQQICIQFYNETGLQAGVNDMSLPWGGLFDIGPPYGPFWQQPHGTHMTGLNADMPFQYLGTPAQRQRFREIADLFHALVLDEGNHFHLTFPN